MIKVKTKKIIVLMLILSLTLAMFSGCVRVKEENVKDEEEKIVEKTDEEIYDQQYPMEVEDDFGNKVTIDSVPKRIISLAPNNTEILFRLELGNKVVGVTNYCDYPKEAKNKEKVGDAYSLNVEKIIELNPDLVLQYGSGNEDVNKRLKEAGIVVLGYEPETIQEVMDLIITIGEITQTQIPARMVTLDMMSKMDYLVHKVENAEKPKVFYEVWNEPLMTAGPGSFIDELINLGGGENIAKDAEGKYPQFEFEQLIERNPDVYITAKDSEDKTVEAIKLRDGYDTMNAIENDRVYILDPNIITRPGPRIVDGLELMAKSIHPELFTKK